MLEEKPLYSRWKETFPEHKDDLNGDPINMFCDVCKSDQTFNCIEVIFNGENLSKKVRYKSMMIPAGWTGDKIDGVISFVYHCTKCHKAIRFFILKLEEDGTVMKIGQFPAASCNIPKEISSLEDKEIVELYKKGRISENQSYGIGAFSYYRRIIEYCIDKLIDSIESIIPQDKKQDYKELVTKVKKEKNAMNKIELVKNTIIDNSIDGNPFNSIYKILSIGIHSLKDEECLECADSLRTLLMHVVEETNHARNKKEKLEKSLPEVNKLIKKFEKYKK